MDFKQLETFKFSELRRIAQDMGLSKQKDSKGYIKVIVKAFKEYEEYKKVKVDRYTKIEQLGSNGKEGTVYRVKDARTGREYAMKCFRKTKSSTTMMKEIAMQELAAAAGVCPKIVDYDTVSKYIVMEKLDQNLHDILRKRKGELSQNYQKQMVSIFEKLDNAGIFHNDASPLNFMVLGKKLYIIDFGFAKKIDTTLIKKYDTRKPNMKFMPLGFLLKMREIVPDIRYEILEKNIPVEMKKITAIKKRRVRKKEISV